jgi:hypothetical protein
MVYSTYYEPDMSALVPLTADATKRMYQTRAFEVRGIDPNVPIQYRPYRRASSPHLRRRLLLQRHIGTIML